MPCKHTGASLLSAQDAEQADVYLDAHIRMAWCALQHTWLDSFQYYLRRAESIAQQQQSVLDTLDAHHALRVNIPYTWGLFYETMGDHFKAVDAFRPIVAHPERYQDSLLVSDTYYELGLCYHVLENYSKAITYRQLALQWLPRQALGEQFPYHQALLYLSLGASLVQQSRFTKQDRSSEAQHLYSSALTLLLAYDHPEQAQEAINANYRHLAEWHLDHNNYDSALWQLDQSLHRQADSNPASVDDLLLQGDIYRAMGHFQQAQSQYRRALTSAEATYQGTDTEKAMIHQRISQIHVAKGTIDSALWHIQQSLIQLIDNFQERSISKNPVVDGVSPTKELVESLSLKASTLYQKSINSPQDTASLLLALDTYTLVVAVVNSMRQIFPSLEYKQFLSAKASTIYEAAIQASLRAYELGLTRQDYLAKAFYFSEKGKAATLLEAVRTSEARSFADIPAELLEQENELKRMLTYWENELYQAPDDSSRHQLRNRAFEAREAYNRLVERLEKEYPNYFRLKYATDVTELAELQATLPQNATLLSYSYGDSTLYAFTVRKTSVQYHTVPLDSVFHRRLENVLQTISQYDYQQASSLPVFQRFADDAYGLYQTLVQPSVEATPDLVEQLIIIPDGLLGYLPFDVLLTEKPATTRANYQQLPYLVKQYPVSYEHSATLLTAPPAQQQPTAYSYVGFAPSYHEAPLAESREVRTTLDGQMLGLGQLRYNREEVAFASDLFEGNTYVGAAATEAQFKQQAGQSQLLHLSMHAYAHDENDDFSGLIFTQQSDTTQEDGFLHSNELYNLSLNAELAVLSACETGIGTLARGEGIMSLGRAFKYAGCPNVTMSLWNADDQSTSQIMQQFFTALHEGYRKDEALRQAKLTYLNQTKSTQAHPYYWAAFVQVGNSQPLERDDNFSIWWWLIGGSVLILVGTLLFCTKRY